MLKASTTSSAGDQDVELAKQHTGARTNTETYKGRLDPVSLAISARCGSKTLSLHKETLSREAADIEALLASKNARDRERAPAGRAARRRPPRTRT